MWEHQNEPFLRDFLHFSHFVASKLTFSYEFSYEPLNLLPQNRCFVGGFRQFSAHLTKCHVCHGICTLSPLDTALPMRFVKTRNTTRLKCCACQAKWRWTRPKWCACHENCNTSSENVAKVLHLPHKMTFDTLQNTSEFHEVPRLPRETQKTYPFWRTYQRHGHIAIARTVACGCGRLGNGNPGYAFGKERERKGTAWTGRERKGKEWKGRERNRKKGKGRERKGKKGKGRERTEKEGKGRERTGKEGKEGKGKERLIWKSAAVAWPCSNELAWLLHTVTQCCRAELKLLYFELSPPWHLFVLLLANLLAFYLTYLLAFYLYSISSGILSGISSGILPGISSAICSGISSGILSDISSNTLSGISSGILSGRWGPAVHTELGRSQVEVQRCTLSWEGPRLRSSSVHTELGRSQVEVQRCTLSWFGPRLRSTGSHWAGKLAKSLAKSWQGGSWGGSWCRHDRGETGGGGRGGGEGGGRGGGGRGRGGQLAEENNSDKI